jgi:cobalt-zinc-cadmium efflux system protein
MDAVPPHIDSAAVRECLATLPGVAAMHDLHIWAMSTTETALTAHLVCADRSRCDGLLADARRELDRRFGIQHVTLQIESGERECPLEPANTV